MCSDQSRPSLLFADDSGTIYDHPYLEMAGCSGHTVVRPDASDLVPFPEMSRLYFHPGCPPYGYDPKKKRVVLLTETKIGKKTVRCHAVSAFIQQGWVRLLLPAMDYSAKGYTLPLWAYSAVGYSRNTYWVPAFEIDDNFRWDPEHFDDAELLSHVDQRRKEYPGNRLVRHLERCACEYHCFAAKNFFYRRWEAPIPTSPDCNAGCVGCISHQPGEGCDAPQDRISFVPSCSEIAEPFVRHLQEAPDPIVSFGQGCEGEPLLQGKRIAESIREIRKQTAAGTINLNTNGSLPDYVRELCDSGLDSIRISINSARRDLYDAYYRPRGYGFADVIASLKAARQKGIFVMINYLIFPGVTDQQAELDALCSLIDDTRPDLVHFKNLNIDPLLYLEEMNVPPAPGIGMRGVKEALSRTFPYLQFGYYNRTREHFRP